MKQLTFNVFVEPQQDAFVAYCLETGLVATSLDKRDAMAKMIKLTVRQVEYALKNERLADVYQSAPNDVFQRYVMERTTVLGFMEERVCLDNDSKGGLMIKQTAYAAAC